MTLRVAMNLEGARDLEHALRSLPKASMRKAVIQRAFRKSGAPIVAMATTLLPPGAQRVGIKVEIRAGLSRRQKRGRRPRPNSVEMFLGVGPSRLSHLFEFGTGPRYTLGLKDRSKSGQYRGHMTATPYLRPAWDAGHRAMLDEFGRLLWREIAATAKRYAKKQARLLAKAGVRV